MKVNLSMPDELFEKMVKVHGIPACYRKMTQAIELCQDIEKSDRAIIVAADHRRALEAIFQTTIDNPEKLVRLTQNMNTVKVGDVDLAFSSDELARISAQAGFHGRTTQQFIIEMVTEIKDRMLEKT